MANKGNPILRMDGSGKPVKAPTAVEAMIARHEAAEARRAAQAQEDAQMGEVAQQRAAQQQQVQISVGQLLDEVMAGGRSEMGVYDANDIVNGMVRLRYLAQAFGITVGELAASLTFLTQVWNATSTYRFAPLPQPVFAPAPEGEQAEAVEAEYSGA